MPFMPKKTSPPKRRGYKPKPIDIWQLKVLSGMQCTYEEIAAVVGIGKRQFIDRLNAEPHLRVLIEDGRANGCASIRREQFKLLQAGNAPMAVWLGKQYLGQRDSLDTKVTGNGPNGAIEVNTAASELLASRIARIAERKRTG